jgi:hypothetical protein
MEKAKEYILNKAKEESSDVFPAKKSLRKLLRGLVLFVQLLSVFFFLGKYLVWEPVRPEGGVLCTVFARTALSIFYKPMIPAMWYCMAHLVDTEGWMLHHTLFTDTLVALIELLVGAWFLLTFAVSLPVLICYVYLPLILLVPLMAYGFLAEKLVSSEVSVVFRSSVRALSPELRAELDEKELEKERAKLTPKQLDELAVLDAVLKRLALFSLLIALVGAIELWPLYNGKSYGAILSGAFDSFSFSIDFWKLEWWTSFWPSKLPSIDMYGLVASLGCLGAEFVLSKFAIEWNASLILDVLDTLGKRGLIQDSKVSLWGGWHTRSKMSEFQNRWLLENCRTPEGGSLW